jgi:hypothetical protein
MASESKRYLATIRLAAEVPLAELGARVQSLHKLVSSLAGGDVQLAFASHGGRLFGIFFKTAVDTQIIRAELDKATTNADRFIVCEIGDLVGHKGLGAAATWLQRR